MSATNFQDLTTGINVKSYEVIDKKARLEKNLGQRASFSFKDIKTLNLAYCSGIDPLNTLTMIYLTRSL